MNIQIISIYISLIIVMSTTYYLLFCFYIQCIDYNFWTFLYSHYLQITIQIKLMNLYILIKTLFVLENVIFEFYFKKYTH